MQSKKYSFYETLTNIAVGYLIAVGAQIAIFPVFGIHIPVQDNFLMGLFFTVVSLVRQYILRRIFNRIKE